MVRVMQYKIVSNKTLVHVHFSDEGMELTGLMLWSLAQLIDGQETLQTIAIIGLGVKSHIVHREINNNPTDITTAAHNVLIHWRKRYEDSEEAYTALCDALRSVNMAFFRTKCHRIYDKLRNS